MRPRFPDLPKRSRIVREDPTAEEANFSNDITFGCQHEYSPSVLTGDMKEVYGLLEGEDFISGDKIRR